MLMWTVILIVFVVSSLLLVLVDLTCSCDMIAHAWDRSRDINTKDRQKNKQADIER